MTKQQREVIADWMMVLGAVILFVSLFLTWDHQLSGTILALAAGSPALSGVPHDPTAWQVYSVADVLLALVAVGLFVVALIGSRPARVGALIVAALALAFVVHAAGSPPTNGVANILPQLLVPTDVRPSPTPGAGITVAFIALSVSISGLGLSFTAE